MCKVPSQYPNLINTVITGLSILLPVYFRQRPIRLNCILAPAFQRLNIGIFSSTVAILPVSSKISFSPNLTVLVDLADFDVRFEISVRLVSRVVRRLALEFEMTEDPDDFDVNEGSNMR
jgi:hypothetical protein